MTKNVAIGMDIKNATKDIKRKHIFFSTKKGYFQKTRGWLRKFSLLGPRGVGVFIT